MVTNLSQNVFRPEKSREKAENIPCRVDKWHFYGTNPAISVELKTQEKILLSLACKGLAQIAVTVC
jgi:hypothetical protein